MSSFLKEWITNLTTAALIGALADIILPGSSFKKYVRFIIGLIILIVLLQPILTLTGNMKSIDRMVEASVNNFESSVEVYDSRGFEKLQSGQILNLYKKNMENQIEVHLKNIFRFSEVKAEVELASESNDEGMYRLERVILNITEKNNTIKPVDIDISGSGNQNNINEPGSGIVLDIKKELNEFLEISPEVVHIHITN